MLFSLYCGLLRLNIWLFRIGKKHIMIFILAALLFSLFLPLLCLFFLRHAFFRVAGFFSYLVFLVLSCIFEYKLKREKNRSFPSFIYFPSPFFWLIRSLLLSSSLCYFSAFLDQSPSTSLFHLFLPASFFSFHSSPFPWLSRSSSFTFFFALLLFPFH